MSSALNTSIYSRLAGVEVLTGKWLAAQQAIAGILGVDPDTDKPNVYKGNLNNAPFVKDANGIQMPIVTFRSTGGQPDRRFAHGLAVNDSIVDMEIWSWYHTANTLSDIEAAVSTLLDRRLECPPLPLSSGAVAWFDPFVLASELYDDQRNAWFSLIRWSVIEMRE